jgi:hypothetical protein
MAWSRTLIAAILVAALGTAGTWAQTPQVIDPQKAQAWLEQTFGIKSERVVEADPNALAVLRAIEPRPPSDFRVIVHLETFSPANPLTPPSSDEEYFINCPSRRFHVERIESFSQSGGRGAQSTSFGPSGWGKAVPDSLEARVVSAVCGADPARAAIPAAQPAPPPSPQPPRVDATPSAPTSPPSPAAKPGPGRAQLFAAADRATAQRFVDDWAARLPRIAAVAKPEVVQASSGGHPIFRVQVSGFPSAAEAARYCSMVKAAGQDCFVPPEARR